MKKTAFFILAAGFALFCGMQRAAAADNPPDGSWTVGPINAKSSSGVGYCSMKNSFKDGQTLVFARNAEGSNSLAVDFGRKSLTVGAQYEVTLEAGFNSRIINAIAATNSVLILQLGDDRDFYDTLRHKNLLQVSYRDKGDEKSFGFGLEGTADALTALNDCVKALAAGKEYATASVDLTPQPPGPVVAPAVPVTDSELKQATDLQGLAMKESLQSEVARLHAENQRLLLENQQIAAKMQEAAPTDVEKQLKAEAANDKKSDAVSKKHKPARISKDKEDDESAPEKSPVILSGLLKQMRITATRHDEDGKEAYVWTKDGINGSLQSVPVEHMDFTDTVDSYIADAGARCDGDFAHKTAKATVSGKLDVLKGEMACIDGKNDASAALLFIRKDGQIAVFTAEGATDLMDTALSQRDAAFTALSAKKSP